MTVLLQMEPSKEPKTTKDVKPDFEGEKYYHWQHMTRKAREAGVENKMPRKPRRTQAEKSFFQQVDRKMSQKVFSVGISFDKDGRIIRPDNT